ncbi:DUF6484 domain-containing protein [Roseateles amylovorans]|uniref:DUF6484 domain-containing protein n=1 Tax=Roseateles amylovorans TaxID=2978473 RepID=A0ABY6BAQ7_9BURK|nr:DUF6484 domain-containing protein [Roseateles amylovorans]UXH80660.1 DUF6484 domain-containing protein [Roseateles amylovorans]
MNSWNDLPVDEHPLTSRTPVSGPPGALAGVPARGGAVIAGPDQADLPPVAPGHDPLDQTPLADEPDYRSVLVGRLLGLVDKGRTPLVVLPPPLSTAGRLARSIVDLHHDHIGAEVLLTFEQADPMRPIVMGVLRAVPATDTPTAAALEVRMDGGRVLLDAQHALVLRCGKSHLTLHEDGRVEVHGETIVTRAAGANKVQGGSVQLN